MKQTFRRMTSMVLALAIMIGMIPNMGTAIIAAGDNYTIGVNKVVDNAGANQSSIDDWKAMFGPDVPTSQYAGGVWTDKSVFTDYADFAADADFAAGAVNGLSLKDNNNFVVALSAMTANKEITGYSYIPTDTVLVLDFSGSMNSSNGNEIADLVPAANAAIKTLLELNNHNRIAVVAFSGSSEVGSSTYAQGVTTLLPLDRYTTGSDGAYLSLSNNNGQTVRVDSDVRNSNNQKVNASKGVVGGTYTQSGMLAARSILMAADTVIPAGQWQAGQSRLPVIVLMSDGAPSTATSNYTVSGTSNMGDGRTSNINEDMAFVNQLTASYVMNSVESHYGCAGKGLMYTLGLGVNNDDIATATLNPTQSAITNSLWSTYNNLSGNRSMTVDNPTGSNRSVTKNSLVTDKNYVDNYWGASSTADMVQAFSDIVNEIKLQSKYYATDIAGSSPDIGGVLDFEDMIGSYMEVKNITGIAIGNTLYSGADLANKITDNSQNGAGTIEKPTALGLAFREVVKARVGLTENQQVFELLNRAWNAGQISYTSDSEFSNFLGYYTDADGKYLGFWYDGSTTIRPGSDITLTTAPASAAYKVKSYAFAGTVKTSWNDNGNLTYVNVLVKEDINTGEQTVVFNIPASLIPMVTYSVTVNGDSLAASTTAHTTTNADNVYPIQLLYEVGLKEGINSLNIAEKVTESKYIADDGYTRQLWTNHFDISAADHADHITTKSEFTPGLQNEIYYYTEDSVIYYKDGNTYKVAQGSNYNFSGTYYQVRYAFVVNDREQPKADAIRMIYEEISPEVLATRVYDEENNNYYIPLGTVCQNYGHYELLKNTNATESAIFSNRPHITTSYASSTGEVASYNVASNLGNNGKLTIVPATGIKISKTVDVVEPGTQTDNFTFTVSLKNGNTPVSGTFTTLMADLDQITGSSSSITFGADGTATVVVPKDKTLYITGLPAGVTYTVTEQAHKDYGVKNVYINGVQQNGFTATGNVVIRTLQDIDFVNTPITTGNLIINKVVTHPYGDDYAPTTAPVFTVQVELSGGDILSSYEAVSDKNANLTSVNVANNIITFNITDGESVSIRGIDANISYTVTETALPNGFALDANASTALTGIIPNESNASETLVNNYTPEGVPTKKPGAHRVFVDLEKLFEGKTVWNQGESYTFKIIRVDPVTGTAAADFTPILVTVDGSQTSKVVELDDYLTAVGVYQYNISEVVPADPAEGITYDRGVRVFRIRVTDVDMDGKLEIADVYNADDTVVTKEQVAATANDTAYTKYTVAADFTNSYAAVNGDNVSITINKLMSATSHQYPLSGFQFGLYADAEGGEPIFTSTASDANGIASLEILFGTNEIGKTYTYYLREIPGTVDGMLYDDTAYEVVITITDDYKGSAVATFTIDGKAVDSASFTNTFTADGAYVTLTGTKVLEGRNTYGNEFAFSLYESDEDGTVSGEAIETVTENAAGSFLFTTLSFEDPGVYWYVIAEDADTTKPGVTNDTIRYLVKIVVEQDGSVLVPTTTLYKGTENQGVYTFADSASDAAVFSNEYRPDSTSVTLTAKKQLTGKNLNDGDFTFNLYKTDASFDIEGLTPVQTKQNTGIKAVFDTLNYDFDDLQDEQGNRLITKEFYYVIAEKNGGATIDGVTYDGRQFQVVVTVTDNHLTGKLETTTAVLANGQIVSEDNITFNNTYKAQTLKIDLDGNKSMTGRNLGEGEFTFVANAGDHEVTATNKADGSFQFKDLSFNRVGTYTFNVYEKLGGTVGSNGVTYDDEVYTVTVKVKDDLKGQLVLDGDIVIVDSEGNPVQNIVFNNEYSSTTSLTLNASKVFTGREWKDNDQFVFELYNAMEWGSAIGDPIDSKIVNRGAKQISFNPIVYTTESLVGGNSFYYMIKEKNAGQTIDGVTYDTTEYVVRVTVTDDGQGNMTANIKHIYAYKDKQDTVGKRVEAIIFTNNYDANVAGKIDIPAFTKVLSTSVGVDRPLEEGEFTFALYAADKDYNKVGAVLQTVQNDAEGNINFSDITFTENDLGNKYYVVQEVAGNANGITYTGTVYGVKVTVYDDGNGQILATAPTVTLVSGSGDNNTFTNSYYGLPTQAVIEAGKIVTGTGYTMKDGDFSFDLFRAEKVGSTLVKGDAVQQNATNADGKVTFNPIKYSATGTYYYIITEDAGTKGGITYDSSQIWVEVVVSDPGTGTLEAVVNYYTGNQLAIKDRDPKFENLYNADSTDVAFTANKGLSGRPLTVNDFSFRLYEANLEEGIFVKANQLQTKGNAADGTVAFDAVTGLDEAKKYYFVIDEIDTAKGGVTYDKAQYWVTVDVKDDGEGKLYVSSTTYQKAVYTDGEWKVSAAAGAAFVNSYTTAEGTITIPAGGKTVDLVDPDAGYTLNAGDFTFNLYDADQTYTKADLIDSKDNTSGGYFAFDSITVTKADFDELDTDNDDVVYLYYVISEEIPTDKIAGITYDTTAYGVKVKLVDDNLGELIATVEEVTNLANDTAAEEIAFVNTYEGADTDAVFEVGKIVNGTGYTLKDSDFTFNLYSAVLEGNEYVKGEAVQQNVGNIGKKVTFEAVDFTATGTYYYVITENAGTKGGITYDDEEIVVKVVVTDAGEGVLEAEVTYIDSDSSPAGFENTYKADSTDVTFSAGKELSGRPLTLNDFSFRLYEATLEEGVFVKGDHLQTKGNAEDGTVSFDTVTDLNKAQKYYFVIDEINNGKGGVTYDNAQYWITVDVQDDGQGKLYVNSITYQKAVYSDGWTVKDAEEAAFTNSYTTADGVITFPAVDKYLNVGPLVDRVLANEEFSFKLQLTDDTYANGTEVELSKNDADGKVAFNDYTITKEQFDELDTDNDDVIYLYFKVEEVIPEDADKAAGVIYDTTSYGIKVKVVDDQNGNMVAEEMILTNLTTEEAVETIEFNNSYAGAETNATVKVEKVLSGRDLVDGEFAFELYNAEFSLGDADISEPAYTIVGEAIDVKQNTGKDVVFDKFTFTEPGDYYYAVVEQAGDKGGVEYDESVILVGIHVTDNNEGQLVAEIFYMDEEFNTLVVPTFNNSYDAQDGVVILGGYKQLLGNKELVGDDFIFELYEANEEYQTAGEAIAVAKNDKDGYYRFDTITKTEEGTFYYVIAERDTKAENVVYDTTTYGVKATVVDNKEGQLETLYEITNLKTGETAQGINFVNAYNEVVDTGDSSDLFGIGAAMMISALVLFGALVTKKKREY